MQKCRAALRQQDEIPAFPEPELTQFVHNTWTKTGMSIADNWLGLVCRLANRDRRLQFVPGIDPDNPLEPVA